MMTLKRPKDRLKQYSETSGKEEEGGRSTQSQEKRKALKLSQSNFWVGKEVEGRLKGLQTLFIVGDQSIDVILDKLYQCLKQHIIVSHLYFGAGGQSEVANYDTIRYFISRGYLITYEVMLNNLNLVPGDILSSCHIMACISQENVKLLKTTDTVKLETSSLIYCIPKEQFMKTSRDEYQDTNI